MRAAWYERQGAPEDVLQVGSLDVPEPTAGEVRVRIRASGVNPSDTYGRSGRQAPMAFARIIPHQDGSGVIDAVGEGVPAERVGERVWVYEATWNRPGGTAAEYSVVPRRARTGHRKLRRQGARRPRGRADDTINYRSEDVVEAIKRLTDGAGVERIVDVDFGGNLSTTIQALKPDGVVASYATRGEPEPKVPFRALMVKNLTVRAILVYTMPEAAKIAAAEDITRALEAGALRPVIGQRLRLDDIAQAHKDVENGAVMGNTVLRLN